MSLHVRTFTRDNMFFGSAAQYASVIRDTPDGKGQPVVEFDPPFARLRAWLYVIRRLGR